MTTDTKEPVSLENPNSPGLLKEEAPEIFFVCFRVTNKNLNQEEKFFMKVEKKLAPIGVNRFYNLIRNKFYHDMRIFRAIKNFVVQFGLNGSAEVSKIWGQAMIKGDSVKASNKKGSVVFAMGQSPDTRTTQVYINLNDNIALDSMGFAPFAHIVHGMDVVERAFTGYGEAPNQGLINRHGNKYLDQEFPKLTSIISADIVQESVVPKM